MDIGMLKNLLILCGGQSAEHEVSLRSVHFVLAELDRQKFKPIVVLVSRDGCWNLVTNERDLQKIKKLDTAVHSYELVTLECQPEGTFLKSDNGVEIKIDVAFPIMHGPMSEDGTLQGLLELMNLPYVGSGVLGSAVCMHKVVSKILLQHAGVDVADFICITSHSAMPSYQELVQKWHTNALFVKPADNGSSVGISKVKNQQELVSAMQHAWQFSAQVIIEAAITAREIECAVLGNNHDVVPIASCLAEIKPNHDFYSYEAKYLDPNGAALVIPAALPAAVAEKAQALAIAAFRILHCDGMARVDMFVTEDNSILINEVNTIPGFTAISMYPQLMAKSGIKGKELITQLLALASKEHMRKKKLLLMPDVVIDEVEQADLSQHKVASMK